MKPIPAIFCGIQQGPRPFELWTILEPMGCDCHTRLSTLSRQTINAHGFEPIPKKEEAL